MIVNKVKSILTRHACWIPIVGVWLVCSKKVRLSDKFYDEVWWYYGGSALFQAISAWGIVMVIIVNL